MAFLLLVALPSSTERRATPLLLPSSSSTEIRTPPIRSSTLARDGAALGAPAADAFGDVSEGSKSGDDAETPSTTSSFVLLLWPPPEASAPGRLDAGIPRICQAVFSTAGKERRRSRRRRERERKKERTKERKKERKKEREVRLQAKGKRGCEVQREGRKKKRGDKKPFQPLLFPNSAAALTKVEASACLFPALRCAAAAARREGGGEHAWRLLLPPPALFAAAPPRPRPRPRPAVAVFAPPPPPPLPLPPPAASRLAALTKLEGPPPAATVAASPPSAPSLEGLRLLPARPFPFVAVPPSSAGVAASFTTSPRQTSHLPPHLPPSSRMLSPKCLSSPACRHVSESTHQSLIRSSAAQPRSYLAFFEAYEVRPPLAPPPPLIRSKCLIRATSL